MSSLAAFKKLRREEKVMSSVIKCNKVIIASCNEFIITRSALRGSFRIFGVNNVDVKGKFKARTKRI